MTDQLREIEFLSEAGARLAASFDIEGALAGIAAQSVPCFADACVAALFDADGWIRRLPAASVVRCLHETIKPHTWRASATFSGDVHPAILPSLTGEWLDCFARDEEERGAFRRFGAASVVVVPVAASSGKAVGAISLLAASASRGFGAADLRMWMAIGRMAGASLKKGQLFREMAAARNKAEESAHAKDEFLAILSHELRNPLMPVMGWARIFKNHEEISRDPVLREGAQSLERNAADIARLVDDCLDLARISQGKIHMDREHLDLNKVILGSTEAVREAAWEKKLALVTELSPAPLCVCGDRTRLQQVLTNLLVNAVKYTDAGGRISVRSRQDSDEAEIEVRDSGCGIDPEYLEKIFEPFRQGTVQSLSGGAGLGLGLAISRQLVELHTGRIWAESRGPGTGSSFYFRLPLTDAVEEVRQSAHPRVSAKPARPLRILLVEDAQDILKLMKIQLEALGHVVLAATDGAQGLVQARSERPDLIISDIKMPRTDGYSLIRQIREIPETARIPAIALTGLAMRGDVARAREAGFDACVVKPVETRELLRWIHTLTSL